MKKSNKLMLTLLRPLSVAVVLSLSVPVIASAEGSHSGDGSSGSAIKTFASTSTDETSGSTTTTDRTSSETHINNLVEKFRTDSKDTTKDELRAKETEKLKEARIKVCDARKDSIDNRITRTQSRAGSYKEKLDAIYVKVKTFHDSKNLTVTNYDQLVAAVDAAQADAAAKVAALKAVTTTIDCTSQNVADSLSAYKAALTATRDSLKTYRGTLVDLMKAVRQAAAAANPSDTTEQGSNQ